MLLPENAVRAIVLRRAGRGQCGRGGNERRVREVERDGEDGYIRIRYAVAEDDFLNHPRSGGHGVQAGLARHHMAAEGEMIGKSGIAQAVFVDDFHLKPFYVPGGERHHDFAGFGAQNGRVGRAEAAAFVEVSGYGGGEEDFPRRFMHRHGDFRIPADRAAEPPLRRYAEVEDHLFVFGGRRRRSDAVEGRCAKPERNAGKRGFSLRQPPAAVHHAGRFRHGGVIQGIEAERQKARLCGGCAFGEAQGKLVCIAAVQAEEAEGGPRRFGEEADFQMGENFLLQRDDDAVRRGVDMDIVHFAQRDILFAGFAQQQRRMQRDVPHEAVRGVFHDEVFAAAEVAFRFYGVFAGSQGFILHVEADFIRTDGDVAAVQRGKTGVPDIHFRRPPLSAGTAVLMK